jgi:hypothetical protein
MRANASTLLAGSQAWANEQALLAGAALVEKDDGLVGVDSRTGAQGAASRAFTRNGTKLIRLAYPPIMSI